MRAPLPGRFAKHIVCKGNDDRTGYGLGVSREAFLKYELWKDLVFRHGPDKLREFPGFHDEKLKGDRAGQRSSRLNIQYRVVYRVEADFVRVSVIDINAHKY